MEKKLTLYTRSQQIVLHQSLTASLHHIPPYAAAVPNKIYFFIASILIINYSYTLLKKHSIHPPLSNEKRSSVR